MNPIKKLALMFIWVNGLFLVLNAVLIPFSGMPTLNAVCAGFSLTGLVISYMMYTTEE